MASAVSAPDEGLIERSAYGEDEPIPTFPSFVTTKLVPVSDATVVVPNVAPPSALN